MKGMKSLQVGLPSSSGKEKFDLAGKRSGIGNYNTFSLLSSQHKGRLSSSFKR